MNIVIKVGGAFLARKENLFWIDELIELFKQGHRVYLVHGAGPFINKAFAEKGVKPRFHEGQRITSPDEMKIVEEVLSREINRELVDLVLERGGDAIGLSGVDGGILKCDFFDKKLGQVGRVVETNAGLLKQLAEHGIIVLSPVGYGQTMKFNVNADVAATAVAASLPDSLMAFLTGTDGLLDREGQPISKINPQEVDRLIADQTIAGGMIVKVNMIKSILDSTRRVGILNGTKKHAISAFVTEQEGFGTVFTA